MASPLFVGTIAQAAKEAGVSYSAMYHRIKRGTIEAYELHPGCVDCIRELQLRRRRFPCVRGKCNLTDRKKVR